MKLSLIVAASENDAIGKDNQLLWHLPNDLRYFKSKTWALPVIMGRKTFESLSGQALPGRLNIVVTHQNSWSAPDTLTANSLEQGIEIATQHDYKEILIAGGGEIYKQALPLANMIYLTRVHTTIDGDTFFPHIDTAEWECTSRQDFEADAKHAYTYSFEEWERR